MSEKEIIDFGGTLENPKCPDCGKEGFVNKHFSTREENLFKDYELEN